MTVKTFALASAASLVLFLQPAVAQEGSTPATPQTAEPAAPAASEPAPPTTTAAPAKQRHWKHKKKSSSKSEMRTTAELNAQQVQNPGATPSTPTPSATEGSTGENEMHHRQMKKHKTGMEEKMDKTKDDMKTDMMKDQSGSMPTQPTP